MSGNFAAANPYHVLTIARSSGNTLGMKVAVSIPDEIFAEAEALAKCLKRRRSDLYSRALKEFIGHHAPDRITALMNEVMGEVGDEADTFRKAAARRVLKSSEW